MTEEIVALKEAREAPALDLASARLNAFSPLLRLRRYDEARALLEDCREIIKAKGDLDDLGHIFCRHG